jgi:hypothetical protein
VCFGTRDPQQRKIMANNALVQAECICQGFLIECARDMAIMVMAAHILEVNAQVAVTERTSRTAKMHQQVLGRPGFAGTGLQLGATGGQWLSLSVYGQQFEMLLGANPILGILV